MRPLAHRQPDHDFTAQLAELQPRLRAFVLALTGNGPDADEVLQDTNQILWRKRQEFQPGTNFQAWAFQTAAFEARNYLRQRARAHRTEIPSEALWTEIAAQAEAHHAEGAFEERRAGLTRCLEKLPPEDRALLVQRYFENRPLAALAADRGSNQNALAQKLFRLRGAVLRCIQRHMRTAEQREGQGDAPRR
jgi:RNA polymerase sigma-70 factor (ECF subfamily)